jgi:hypothetical protein
MVQFRRRTAACLVLFVLSVGVERLPAPVEELSDTPTPTPRAELARKPTPKPNQSRPDPKTAPTRFSVTGASPAAQPPSFAGNWVGTISQGVAGPVTVTLRINPATTSVVENAKGGTFTHKATIMGDTLTWKAGWLNEITWTLRPNPDGATAVVTSNSSFGVNGWATFRRQ